MNNWSFPFVRLCSLFVISFWRWLRQISYLENAHTYLCLLSTKTILAQFRFCKKTKTIKTPLNCHVDTIKQCLLKTMPWRVVKNQLHDSAATPARTTGSGHFSFFLFFLFLKLLRSGLEILQFAGLILRVWSFKCNEQTSPQQQTAA